VRRGSRARAWTSGTGWPAAVRARPGRSSGLRVSHSKTSFSTAVLYGRAGRAGALNRRKRRFPARAVSCAPNQGQWLRWASAPRAVPALSLEPPPANITRLYARNTGFELPEVSFGLGRIVALHDRSPTVYQIHEHVRCLFLKRRCDRTLGLLHGLLLHAQQHVLLRHPGESRAAQCSFVESGAVSRSLERFRTATISDGLKCSKFTCVAGRGRRDQAAVLCEERAHAVAARPVLSPCRWPCTGRPHGAQPSH
jgi:hypothetical protein